MPPLSLTDSEVDEAVSVLDRAIGDVMAGKVSDEQVASFMMW
jgi:4-aminobutyrate aminotransferase